MIRGVADEKLVNGVLRLLSEKDKYIYIRDVVTGGLLGATLCNAITCNREKFSLSLFAGSLVLGGGSTTGSGGTILFDELVADSKKELVHSDNRVEIVLAPDKAGDVDDNGPVISRGFIGARSKTWEFNVETFPHRHNNALKQVNASLASLYKTLDTL